MSVDRARISASVSGSKPDTSADGSRTVLVVDDDRDLRNLVVYFLETEGYSVKTACDGREGLKAAQEAMPSLILLDMKMPVLDGWGFAREFRVLYGFNVPILVVTAADDAKRRADAIGASGWIGKPFELDALLDAVARHIH